MGSITGDSVRLNMVIFTVWAEEPQNGLSYHCLDFQDLQIYHMLIERFVFY